jgi:hypothetical protein
MRCMRFRSYIACVALSWSAVLWYQLSDNRITFHISAAYMLPAASAILFRRFESATTQLPTAYCIMLSVLAVSLGDVTHLIQTHLVAEAHQSSTQHFLVIHFGFSFTVLTQLIYRHASYIRNECTPCPDVFYPLHPFCTTWYYSLDSSAEQFGREPPLPSFSTAWRPVLYDFILLVVWLGLNWCTNEVIRRRLNPDFVPNAGQAFLSQTTAMGLKVLFDTKGLEEGGVVGTVLGLMLMRPVRVWNAFVIAWGAQVLEWWRNRRWERAWRKELGID